MTHVSYFGDGPETPGVPTEIDIEEVRIYLEGIDCGDFSTFPPELARDMFAEILRLRIEKAAANKRCRGEE